MVVDLDVQEVMELLARLAHLDLKVREENLAVK